MPVIATRDGEVDPVVDGQPTVSLEAPPDRSVGHAGREALPAGQEAALLYGDVRECAEIERSRRSA